LEISSVVPIAITLAALYATMLAYRIRTMRQRHRLEIQPHLDKLKAGRKPN
jgi:ABC-type uncharacterized transport system permease subunit